MALRAAPEILRPAGSAWRIPATADLSQLLFITATDGCGQGAHFLSFAVPASFPTWVPAPGTGTPGEVQFRSSAVWLNQDQHAGAAADKARKPALATLLRKGIIQMFVRFSGAGVPLTSS